MSEDVPVSATTLGMPKEAYAVFCGGIDQASAQKTAALFTNAMLQGYHHVHLLLQSAGGFVGDGVFLYNLFRSVPIGLTLYNAGQVASAAAIAYLGAKQRITGPRATFMLHRTTQSPQLATSAKLAHVAKSLVLDDARTESILREHITMPAEIWKEMDFHDIHLSGEEALRFGIATEIGDFAPPLGSTVFNCLM